MNRDDDRDDELLAAVAAGERGEEDAEIVALFVRDPAARDRLRRIRALAEALDGAGAEQRDVLATLTDVRPAHAALVRAAVAGPRRLRTRGLWLLAAAVVIGGVVALVPWSPRRARPDDVLGTSGVAATPVGSVAKYGEFRWNLTRPPQGWFELVVFDDRDGDRGRELFRVSGLSEPRWTPDAARLELMTDRIAWRVDAIEPGRTVDSAGPFFVQRR